MPSAAWMPMVFILHFSEPYEGVRHFVGVATDVTHLEHIIEDPESWCRSKLLAKARAAGVEFHIGNFWHRDDRYAELLRRQHNSERFCSTCTPASYVPRSM